MQPHPMVIILFSLMFAMPILLIYFATRAKRGDIDFTKKIADEAQCVLNHYTYQSETRQRITRITWDQYFMGLAFAVAQRSEDPSIKHGCVLVAKKNNIILGTGYNGLIPGLSPEYVDIFTRPRKYDWMRHAEENALKNTSQPVQFVDGGVKAYVTGFPCPTKPGCLQLLVSSGIKDIYVARRRGYLNHDEQIQQDSDFIVAKLGINITYIELDEVSWLNNIDLN